MKIRKKLGIKPDQRVNLTVVDDKAFITSLPEDPIKALRGMLKSDQISESASTCTAGARVIAFLSGVQSK